MPKFCETCGCEHKTQEEIEEEARAMIEVDVSTYADAPRSKKIRLKKP